MKLKVGDRINIWIAGEAPVPFRAEVCSTVTYKDNSITSVLSCRPVAQDGRKSPALLSCGKFVVISDQTPPAWEAAA